MCCGTPALPLCTALSPSSTHMTVHVCVHACALHCLSTALLVCCSRLCAWECLTVATPQPGLGLSLPYKEWYMYDIHAHCSAVLEDACALRQIHSQSSTAQCSPPPTRPHHATCAQCVTLHVHTCVMIQANLRKVELCLSCLQRQS